MNILTGLGSIWNTFFYFPLVNVIVFISKFTGYNLGVSIIIITILVRLLLWPFMKSQVESFKKMQDIKPKVDLLKKKYKDDKAKFQEEQLKLYKENGVNPLGSCLPLIIQLPFIYALYNVIRTISISKSTVFNHIVYFHYLFIPKTTFFNTSFLGINLAKNLQMVGFKNFIIFSPYIFLILLVGITQFMSGKVTMPIGEAEIEETVEIIEADNKKKKGGVKSDKLMKVEEKSAETKKSSIDPEEFSKSLSQQMTFVVPFFLMWLSSGFAGFIPSALSLYWATQSLLVVFQTLYLQKKLNTKNIINLFKIKPAKKQGKST